MSDDAVTAASAADDDAIAAMHKLHVSLGRKAAELAMRVLDNADLDEIPFPAAVSLLKFGVELERKALLGVEDGDGSEVDPFDELAKALTKQEPKEG